MSSPEFKERPFSNPRITSNPVIYELSKLAGADITLVTPESLGIDLAEVEQQREADEARQEAEDQQLSQIVFTAPRKIPRNGKS